MPRCDELREALDQAQAALDSHRATVYKAAWYQQGEAVESGLRAADATWTDELEALKLARDEAEDRLDSCLAGEEE